MPSEQLQTFAWGLRFAWRGQGEGQVAVVYEQLKFQSTGFELVRALRTSLLIITCL